MTWTAFLFAYLFGGLTFLPLLVTAVLAHFYFSSPYREDADPNRTPTDDKIVQPGDNVDHLDAAQKDAKRSLEPDVAAGYFAVCREYVPMGINAKPIERATPVGSTTVAAPSPSVYQTMYRSIFDRKPAPGPLDDKSNVSQRPKKAGNVFYVVMRHGHLMLFDDDEQLEVRHVISLAHHDVSLYSGEDETPEGELFIKRNAICLSRKPDGPDLEVDSQLSRPFYLFSENCSAKEDFYFALLRNQLQSFGSRDKPPSPLQFDVKNVISLVQKLHSTDDHSQTRWLNALIGRVFLGVSKTKAMEDFIREKLEKKLSRVKKPAFLPNIAIKGIDTGDSGPFIMNPRLRDLSVEGDCGVEMDIKYTGKFRIEVAATARIDLGTRFKAREVNLVLAVVVRKLEGHLLLKIKPPPSNRVWFTFQQMPKLDLAIEPIVSSRQITYTVILRQIENRIKEIVAETLVLPFWDDMVFFHTEGKRWRGGIFEENQAAEAPDLASVLSGMNSEECEKAEDSQGHTPLQDSDLPPLEKSQSSVPATETEGQRTGLFGRKLSATIKKSDTFATTPSNASSTSIETGVTAPPVPRPSRSTTFVQPPTPVTGTDASNAEFFKPSSPSPNESPAIAAMATLSARSRPAAECSLDSGSVGCTNLVEPHATSKSTNGSSSSSLEGTDNEKDADLAGQMAVSRRNTVASAGENSGADSPSNPSVNGSIRSQTASLGRAFFGRRDSTTSTNSAPVSPGHADQKKRTALGAVTDAAASARRWGLGALQRHSEAVQSRNNSHTSDEPLDLNQPIGRGRPLPPPGQPLPMPEKRTTRTPVPVAKRKPVPPPEASPTKLPLRENGQAPSWPNMEGRRVPPPPLPTRRRAADEDAKASPPTPPRLPPRAVGLEVSHTADAHVLVVAAPLEEETVPSPRPVHQAYVQPWVQDGEESFMNMTSSPTDHEEVERVERSQEKAVPHNQDTGHGQDNNYRHDQKSRNRQSEERISIEEDLDDDEFSAWMDNITGPAEPARAVLAGEDFVH